MGKWVRLAVMLGIIAAAGILLVQRQTAVIVKGYRLSCLLATAETEREIGRKARIALEEERLPSAIHERAKALGIGVDAPALPLYSAGAPRETDNELSGPRKPGRAAQGNTNRPVRILKGEGR